MHDLFTGEMTWRELRTFVRQLPRESAFVRAVLIKRGDNPDWTIEAEFARCAANELIKANYQRAGKRTPDGALIPEQGRKTRARAAAKKKPMTQAEFDALFGG